MQASSYGDSQHATRGGIASRTGVLGVLCAAVRFRTDPRLLSLKSLRHGLCHAPLFWLNRSIGRTILRPSP